MDGRRSLARFLVIAALAFGVAMIPSRAVERAYASWFRASLSAIYAPVPGIVVEPLGKRAKDADTRLTIRGRNGHARWSVGLRSRGSGYLPTCVFTALVIASPIGWKRRARAAIVGGLLLHAYVAVAAGANLIEQLSKHAGECACLRSRASWLYADWWRDGAATLLPAMRLEPTVFLLVPVLIWAVTCLRRDDWRELIAPRHTATTTPRMGAEPARRDVVESTARG